MATWACGHRRQPEFTFLGLATRAELKRMADGGEFSAMARDELRQRADSCPSCAAQNQRNRRHWAALTLGLLVAFLVVCCATAAACRGWP